MVVDGDNKGHCVGYAIIRDEKLVTFAVIFHEFVLKNSFLKSSLKTVVVDKDASEIGAIKLTMPQAHVLLCRFHVRKALNSNVDSLCPKPQREEVKEVVRKLVWTDREDKFMEAYDLLVEGSDFKRYFDTNWMIIRDHWANYLTKHLTTWGNKTTNFVERHNRALKAVGSSKLGLADFIAELLTFHSREQSSARRKILTLGSTTKLYRPRFQAAEPLLIQANKVLLPHACKELKSQLDILHQKITVFDANVLYEIDTDNIIVSEHPIVDGQCECAYFRDKELPCWHILAYQHAMQIDFLANIHERFYKHTLMNALEIDVEPLPSSAGAIVIAYHARKQTDLQKKQTLLEISRELVSVGVMCGQSDFDRRVVFLKKVIGLWRDGKEITTASLQSIDPVYVDSAPPSPVARHLPADLPSPAARSLSVDPQSPAASSTLPTAHSLRVDPPSPAASSTLSAAHRSLVAPPSPAASTDPPSPAARSLSVDPQSPAASSTLPAAHSLPVDPPSPATSSTSPTAHPLPVDPPSPAASSTLPAAHRSLVALPSPAASTYTTSPAARPLPAASPSISARSLPAASPSPAVPALPTVGPSSAAPPTKPASGSVDELVFSFLGKPVSVTRLTNSSLDAVFDNKVKTKGRRKGEGKTVTSRKRKAGPSAPRQRKNKLPRTICGQCKKHDCECNLYGDIVNDCLDWIECVGCRMTFHCLCVGFSTAPRVYTCRACSN